MHGYFFHSLCAESLKNFTVPSHSQSSVIMFITLTAVLLFTLSKAEHSWLSLNRLTGDSAAV